MKKTIIIDFGQPGVVIDDIRTLGFDPKGIYAYGRTSLYGAVNLLSYCIKNIEEFSKLIPEVEILMPCPALFNAYYESNMVIHVTDDMPLTSLDDMRSYAHEHGFAAHGKIKINDAMVDTVLFLSNTRRLYTHYIGISSKRIEGESSAYNMQDALSEMNALFDIWDEWIPKSRLDLSRSKDIPNISDDASVESLWSFIPKYDPGLFFLLFIVVCHEYGHMLFSYDEINKKKLLEHADILIILFSKGLIFPQCREVEECINLIHTQKEVYTKWQNEIACDLLGIIIIKSFFSAEKNNVIRTFFSDKNAVLEGLILLSMILCVIEKYFIRRFSVLPTSYPFSYIRLGLLLFASSDILELSYSSIMEIIHKVISINLEIQNNHIFSSKG